MTLQLLHEHTSRLISCPHTVDAWFQSFGDLSSKSLFSPARKKEKKPVSWIGVEGGVGGIRDCFSRSFVCVPFWLCTGFIGQSRLLSGFKRSKIVFHGHIWSVWLCPLYRLFAPDHFEGLKTRSTFKMPFQKAVLVRLKRAPSRRRGGGGVA